MVRVLHTGRSFRENTAELSYSSFLEYSLTTEYLGHESRVTSIATVLTLHITLLFPSSLLYTSLSTSTPLRHFPDLPPRNVVVGVALVLPFPVGARRSTRRARPHPCSVARPPSRTTQLPPYHRYSWLASRSFAGVGLSEVLHCSLH